MRDTIAVCFTVLMLAGYAFCGDPFRSEDASRQSEFVRLMLERSQIMASLEENPSPEIATKLRTQLKKIQRRLRDMGIDIPAPPAPLMGEVDRTDLPIPRPEPPSLDGGRYRFDLIVSPSFSDNYFQAVDGTAKRSAWVTHVSSSLQFALARKGNQQLSLGLDLQRNNVEGIQDANWNSYGARLSYSTRNNQLTFQGIVSPRRLTFITRDGDSGRGTTLGIGSDYSQKLAGRARMRLFYRWNEVHYPEYENRDVRSHVAAADVQYHFHNLFAPGIGFEWTEARANLENYSYVEKTPIVLLSSRFGRAVTLNLRYRHRNRLYPVENSQASNYRRRDRRHDGYMYLSINLGGHLGLIVYGSYLQNISARADRGFKSLSGGVTLKCLFPGR
jgi:hypothetical protein